MDGFVTIILINAALRKRHPELPGSETFLVIHRDGDTFTAWGSDEHRPDCLDPYHWAQKIAAYIRVEYREPDANVAFYMHDGVWRACDVSEMADDGKQVGPAWDSVPVVKGVIRNANRAVAA